MIYDFIKEIEEAEVRDISLYEEPVKYDPVEIDLVDVKTDKVIGETYERLAFKRVMKNRDNRLYAYLIVRHNLAMHCSVTPFIIWQPIWRPRLLERVYKPMHTSL